jgi:hypothetical protein
MKKYILIIAVFFSIGISGCKKDYLSQEVNPNYPSVAPPGLTLAGALVVAAQTVNQGYPQDGVWVQYITRSGNYVPSPALDQFQLTNQSYTGVWTTLYQNLTNFNNLQVAAAKDPTLSNYQAIAMIMKAFDFQQLVDQFGDVPYSQAFQPSTILFPKYDKGIDIYHDLGKQLDAAIALAGKSGAANPGVADVVFGGNMANWQKLANSIKLRLAIRISTTTPGDALVTDLASTASVGYLDGTTQALVQPGYSNTLSGSNSQQSPYYASFGFDVTGNPTGNNAYFRANTYFINKLNGFNDPRLAQFYYPVGTAGNTTFIDGNIFGAVSTAKSNAATSAIGPGLLQSPSQPAVLFSGAESLFLQAEAALDKFIPGDPQTLYQAGITASFVALRAGSVIGLDAAGNFTVTPASAATSTALAVTYYSQSVDNVGYAASPNKQEAIIYQKWIALSGYNNLEGYLEYLRTGFPVLPTPVSIDPSAVSTTLPVRQYYPLSEVTSNTASVGAEGTINIFTSKLFWEK